VPGFLLPQPAQQQKFLHRFRGLEVQGAEVLRFRCAEVQRGDAEMRHRCRDFFGAEVLRCRKLQSGGEWRREEV